MVREVAADTAAGDPQQQRRWRPSAVRRAARRRAVASADGAIARLTRQLGVLRAAAVARGVPGVRERMHAAAPALAALCLGEPVPPVARLQRNVALHAALLPRPGAPLAAWRNAQRGPRLDAVMPLTPLAAAPDTSAEPMTATTMGPGTVADVAALFAMSTAPGTFPTTEAIAPAVEHQPDHQGTMETMGAFGGDPYLEERDAVALLHQDAVVRRARDGCWYGLHDFDGALWQQEWDLAGQDVAHSEQDVDTQAGCGLQQVASLLPAACGEDRALSRSSPSVDDELSEAATLLDQALIAAVGVRPTGLFAMTGVASAYVQRTLKEGGDAQAAAAQALPVLRAFLAQLVQSGEVDAAVSQLPTGRTQVTAAVVDVPHVATRATGKVAIELVVQDPVRSLSFRIHTTAQLRKLMEGYWKRTATDGPTRFMHNGRIIHPGDTAEGLGLADDAIIFAEFPAEDTG